MVPGHPSFLSCVGITFFMELEWFWSVTQSCLLTAGQIFGLDGWVCWSKTGGNTQLSIKEQVLYWLEGLGLFIKISLLDTQA